MGHVSYFKARMILFYLCVKVEEVSMNVRKSDFYRFQGLQTSTRNRLKMGLGQNPYFQLGTNTFRVKIAQIHREILVRVNGQCTSDW